MNKFAATTNIIACTLNTAELRDTRAAWEKLLRNSLISRRVVPGGVRLVLHPGSADALKQLIDIEHECCRWIIFEMDGATVTMTAAGLGALVIRQTWTASHVPNQKDTGGNERTRH